MDLLELHFAKHALSKAAETNPALLPALAAVDAEIAATLQTTAENIDHGALVGALLGQRRSSHWPMVEHEFKSRHPECAAGGRGPIQAHHINPFHYVVALGRPDLELDERNLIGLTESSDIQNDGEYHLLLGHKDNFKLGNLGVSMDAVGRFHGMACSVIRLNPIWQAIVPVKALELMTSDERRAYRLQLDSRLPPDPAVLKRFTLTVGPLQ